MSDTYNYFISLGPNILLGALFSETLILFAYCILVYAKNGYDFLHMISLSSVAYVTMYFLLICMYANTNGYKKH